MIIQRDLPSKRYHFPTGQSVQPFQTQNVNPKSCNFMRAKEHRAARFPLLCAFVAVLLRTKSNFGSPDYLVCVVHAKTIINLKVSESGGYLPRRFAALYCIHHYSPLVLRPQSDKTFRCQKEYQMLRFVRTTFKFQQLLVWLQKK